MTLIESLAFGAIISATDPGKEVIIYILKNNIIVAVLALFKEN